MALTLVESAFTYRSDFGGVVWFFTVVSNQTGTLGIRNILSPTGRILDSGTQIPQTVLDDQQLAIGQVENLLASTSAVNGILTFTAETSKTVNLSTPFANTNYRVLVSSQDFVPFRITTKTLTEFTIEAGTTYTGQVGFDVFV